MAEEWATVEKPPHILVRQIAWDGWEAFCEDRPLICARESTAIEALENVLQQLTEAGELK